jgi:small subunit ribosomal protein S4
MIRKAYPPGMHGESGGNRRISEFGKQLSEKQKLKKIYGISERQLKRHLQNAKKKEGTIGNNLIAELEMRLDNIIFRLNLAASRAQARQLVSHKMFLVNGKTLNIPSAKIKVGDKITIKSQKAENKYFKNVQLAAKKKKDTLRWLYFDGQSLEGKVLSFPSYDEVPVDFNPAVVIEFYSR